MIAKPSLTQSAVLALAEEIREGRYPEGRPMPSESQLATRFGVSRTTVRVILSRLEREGLIYRQQGRGTFARPGGPSAAKPVAFWLKDLGRAGSPYMSELIAGADQYLSSIGSHVSVTSVPLTSWPAAFCQSLAGVIMVPFGVEASDLDLLRAYGLAWVTIQESDLPGPLVGMDTRGAARAITEGLLALGHRSFGLVSGHTEHSDRQKRLGIADALAAAGLALEDMPDLQTGYAVVRGREAAERLLTYIPRPTAIICFDDTLALQVLAVAQQHGLKVPEQLSITGFNDSPFSALVSPPLSTVRFPVHEAGAVAARMLYQADHEAKVVTSVFLHHELIWRSSTGPVSKN